MLICLMVDNIGWWRQFENVLKEMKLPYRLIMPEVSTWMEEVGKCDAVIWRFNLQEPYRDESSDKLHYIEFVLKKNVFPNAHHRWHYNNKLAQAYLAHHYQLKMPPTFVSYSYEEVLSYLETCSYPIVSKSAGGAASRNVRLLENYDQARKEADVIFRQDRFTVFVDRMLNKFKLMRKLRHQQYGYVSYQKFVAGNSRDYRVTTIGCDKAFAFHRNNRPNDFRASGSGLIDYDGNQDFGVIKYCLDISNKLGFDSMAYDIVYDEKDFYILEFSYTYSDVAIYNAPGYFTCVQGQFQFVPGHVWPQQLIMEHMLSKWKQS
ncbi:MAG: hypothetical protein ABFD98_13445 [Syntrophobacteraceae bacterium]